MNTPLENQPAAESLTPGDTAPPVDLAQKVVALESYLMHVQHDTEMLHQALLDLQRKYDVLSKVLRMHDDRLQRLLGEGEKFDLELDRPPHY